MSGLLTPAAITLISIWLSLGTGISESTTFNTSGEPDAFEIATSENTISGIVEKQSSYQDLKYSVSDLPEYSSFAIKIVMSGSDPAFVPKVQDIRAVAAF